MENAAINITFCLNSNSPETALGSVAIAGLYTARMTFCLQVFLPQNTPAEPEGKESPHCRLTLLPPALGHFEQLLRGILLSLDMAGERKAKFGLPQATQPNHPHAFLTRLLLLHPCPVNWSLVFCFKAFPRIRN